MKLTICDSCGKRSDVEVGSQGIDAENFHWISGALGGNRPAIDLCGECFERVKTALGPLRPIP